MTDFLSALPAPLPLYVLLELPDLKALYAAVLASPRLQSQRATDLQDDNLPESGHRKRLSTFEMLRLNSSLARIRIKTDRRPDGRLFGTNARIFENFGFGFWYEERLIDELWLNCRGYRVGDPQPKIDWNNLPHNYCTASDEHFRPLKLYQQQVEREQQGWHR
ncbi:hypothetical protein E4T38_08070 [Aureobasidium subglaciale]|nr:hypothetical protein E4T38_08070 [Aureobasidium subglaciale]KAI5216196.1 hypothetical protein E4T40_08080 [Aureobasidium subglaciale]KAI5219400.1 hypothetical protein E4T41_07995 [Aureobasidium subglaciale]KAI5256880.1 hypothetical protein E4T46_07971 [Aureobasidium subglaciale]